MRLTKGYWRYLRWCLVLLFASGAVAQQDPERIIQLPTIVEALGQDFTLTFPGAKGAAPTIWNFEEYLYEPRCLVHPLKVSEQGYYWSGTGYFRSGTDVLTSGADYYRSGTVGGVAIGGIVGAWSRSIGDIFYDTTPPSLQSGRSTQLSLGEALWIEPAEHKDVVIVVADDFGSGIYTLPARAFSIVAGQQPGSQQQAVDGGDITHGALVMHFLNALISATDYYEIDEESSREDWVVWNWRDPSRDARLIVSAQNLNDGRELIDTTAISSGINLAIANAALTLGSRLAGVVVNMSWVVMPCPTVEAFIQNKNMFMTFENYVFWLLTMGDNESLVAGLTPEQVVLSLTWLLTWLGEENPLFSSMHDRKSIALEPSGEERLAFVAASGNFRLPFQMFPAAWPAAVGVGAPLDNQPPPPFSNAAEVIAPGAWFKVEPVSDLPWEKGLARGGTVALAGTSYSAPVVSLFTAVDIAGSGRCTPPLFSGELPRLGSHPYTASIWLTDAAYGWGTKCRP